MTKAFKELITDLGAETGEKNHAYEGLNPHQVIAQNYQVGKSTRGILEESPGELHETFPA